MANVESENLQFLGGLLIVLSLALLYCWSCSMDGMQNTPGKYVGLQDNSYGAFRQSDGFRNMQQTSGLKSLQWANNDDALSVKSMFDLEAPQTSRSGYHILPTNQKNTTGMRWNIDGMIASGDPTDQVSPNPVSDLVASGAILTDYMNESSYTSGLDGAYDGGLNSGLKVPSEVITPMKTCFMDSSGCQSVSGTVLQLSDYKPEYSFRAHYGPAMGYTSI